MERGAFFSWSQPTARLPSKYRNTTPCTPNLSGPHHYQYKQHHPPARHALVLTLLAWTSFASLHRYMGESKLWPDGVSKVHWPWLAVTGPIAWGWATAGFDVHSVCTLHSPDRCSNVPLVETEERIHTATHGENLVVFEPTRTLFKHACQRLRYCVLPRHYALCITRRPSNFV